MKNLYILTVLMFSAAVSNAQVDIHYDGDPGVSYNGSVVNVSGTTSIIYPNLRIVNSSGVNADYIWRRVVLSNTVSFTDQVCDNLQCYDCTGTSWDRPAAITIPVGDSTLLQPKVIMDAGGTVSMRYYVMDGTSTYIDSVDVNFSSTVGVDSKNDIQIAVFPNPASDMFNIQLTSNETNLKVKVYNVLGEQVILETLKDGMNTLNVSVLNNGVYFYSILKNEKTIQTKKLIVRK